MPTERKRKRDIEAILSKLTTEQREFLSELDPEERAETFEFFSQYTSKEIVILRRVRYHKPVSEKQMEFAYEVEGGIEEIERIDPIFYDIASKLAAEDLELILIAAVKFPDSFLYEPVPAPVPVTPIPTRPEDIPPVKKAEEMVKVPYKWRTRQPLLTVTFIREFLEMRGDKGASPYDAYWHFKRLLWKIITDEAYRKKLVMAGEIKLDGETIDGVLTEEISRYGMNKMIRACPGIHIGSYNTFWRYFKILEWLGLIKKKGGRIKSPKFTIKKKEKIDDLAAFKTRQIYILNEALKDTPLWDKGWGHPQSILYPLAGLGRRYYVYQKEIKMAKERGKIITTQELFIEKNRATPEEKELGIKGEIDELAELLEVPEEKLINCILKGDYRELRYPR